MHLARMSRTSKNNIRAVRWHLTMIYGDSATTASEGFVFHLVMAMQLDDINGANEHRGWTRVCIFESQPKNNVPSNEKARNR